MKLHATALVFLVAALVQRSSQLGITVDDSEILDEVDDMESRTGLRTKFPKPNKGQSTGVQEKKVVSPGEIPYIVSVQVNNEHMAPGAIINRFFVFVEGYFIDVLDPMNTTVLAGRTDVKNGQGGTVHRITRMIKHENMVWPHNDVGLLQVCPPFSPKFRRVILPLNGLKWPSNSQAKAVYFDSNGKLTSVSASVLSDAECNGLNLPNNWNAQTEVCTHHAAGNSCIFPYYPLLLAKGKLAGAQTWGVCNTNKTVSMMSEQFVDVAMYTKWIRKHSVPAKVKCT